MMALYERKIIEFEGRRLKGMSKETKSPELIAINHRGLTPTLIDADGSIISESLAILHYLENYYRAPLLMPTEKAEHIAVMRLIQEAQNLVNIYEPLEYIGFRRQSICKCPTRTLFPRLWE